MDTPGKINIDVDKSLVIKGDTTINSSTSGAGEAGNVELSAGTLELDHATITVSGAEGSTGEAGTIHLMADQLSLKGAAIVAAEARGEGNAGEVRVEAMSSMTITGRSTISSSTFGFGAANLVELSAQTMTIDGSSITANNARRSTGEAGRIALTVGTLTLDNRAQVTASAEGIGAGGKVNIDAAERVTIRGASAVTTSAAESNGGTIGIRASSPGLLVELIGRGSNINASVEGGGEEVSGGNIDVMAAHVRLQGGASIESTAEGRASGGNIMIKVGDALELESEAFVSSDTFGLGQGGVVSVEADIIRLSDGAILSSGTFGQAAGGDVKVRARSVVVDKAFIVSDTFGAGSGGDILFEIDRLEVIGEAKIASRSIGRATGRAGTVTVRGQIEGQLPSHVAITDSAIVTEAERADGGQIEIMASVLELHNSMISSVADQNGGVIKIAASGVALTDSTISSVADQANGGNIELSADRIELNNSEITAVSKGGVMTKGGDVILQAKEVVLRSSIVVTNAEGVGADIKIPEGVFIADPESALRAAGQVLNTGEVLETGGVVQVLLAFSQPETLESHPCANQLDQDQASSFALVGREALPLEPGNVLLSDLSVEGPAKRHRHRHTPSQGLR